MPVDAYSLARTLHFVGCEANARRPIFKAFLEQHLDKRVLIISHLNASDDDLLTSYLVGFRQINQYLGQEFDQVLLDIYSGINPNVLMLVAGWIRGGGALTLLGPPQHLWHYFDDPELLNLHSIALSKEPRFSLFNPRLAQFIRSFTALAKSLQSSTSKLNPFTEHDSLIGRLSQVLLQKGQAKVVLTALRGRGKSTALGLIAGIALKHKKHVVITAPSKAAAGNVFLFAGKNIGTDEKLVYYSPPDLLTEKPRTDIVLVDEAAAIPVYHLLALIPLYKKIVFTSTIEGYEGTGGGFARKVIPRLQEEGEAFSHFTLNRPLRWRVDDPLEAWVSQLFISAASSAEQAHTPYFGQQSNAPQIKTVTQQELVSNEVLLKRVFQLLIKAHYQTSANDLKYLLDAPNLRIVITLKNEAVLGVCLVCAEGGWVQKHIDQVLHGKRRFKGDFLAQSFVLNTLKPELACLRAWRIMRIAVLPELERQGIARAMLNYVKGQAQQEKIDYLGCYFGMDLGLLAFWSKLGFRPCQLGSKRDHVSGQYALCCLLPLTERAAFSQIYAAFFDALMVSTQRWHAELELAQLAALLHSTQPIPKPLRLREEDRLVLQAFVSGGRSLESVVSSLIRLSLAMAAKDNMLPSEQRHLAFMLYSFVQNHRLNDLVKKFNFVGKKAVSQHVKEIVMSYYEAQ